MSYISTIDPKSADSLSFGLRDAIEKAILNGHSEPSMVANLTYEIPKEINSRSIGAGAGFSVRVGGVFVHQTPRVTFPGIVDNKYIEIGDLLLISTIKSGKQTFHKAMLYQAKKPKTFPAVPDNQDQHYLYQYWPEFEYVKSRKELNGKVRSVVGLDLHSAAKYLLLAKGIDYPILPNFFQFPTTPAGFGVTCHATSPLSVHECFIRESYRFALGDAGKEFELLDDADPDRGWSRVITDLINVTATRTTALMKSASSGASSKRGVSVMLFGDGLSFLSDDTNKALVSNDEPPADMPPMSIDNDDNGSDGISILEFVLEGGE